MNDTNEIKPPDEKDFPGPQYWADKAAWRAYELSQELRKKLADRKIHPDRYPYTSV
jgi:hypothetical protein